MALKKFILSSSVLVGILLCGLVYADRIEVYQDEKASDAAALNDDFETIVVLGNINDTYSEITEDAEKLVKMPGSFGDPLGAITAIPGVVSAGDGGEPVVRGSSPEDNRYYVDNMPAGYIFHEFNTSIFDRNVVQDFQLYTSGFGTEFSQATGAVFDIRLRDPNREELSAVLDFSLLRSGLFLESGIGENAGAYISLRKGMLEYFVSEEDEPNEDGVRVISAPSDSDYLVKGVWDIGKNNVVSAVFSGASDSVQAEFAGNNDITEKNPDFAGDAKVDLNFDNQGINWIHQTKNKKFQLTMANYLDEEFTSWGNNYFVKLEQNSKIVRAQLDYKISQNHSLSFGTEYSQNSFDYANRMILFVCSEFDSDCQDSRRDLIELDDKIEINESSVYLNDHWQATPKLSFIFGAQYAGNDFTDEYFINPRVTGSLQINSFLTFTASGGRYNGTPEAENLIPQVGNPDLKSPTADHYSLGVKGSINNLWSWSCETYYKKLENLPLSLDESSVDANTLYSNDVEGEVRGLDIMLNRNLSNRWYGWVSVSLADSQRTNLRTGKSQNYAYDTPVVLNIVADYQLSEKWEIGARYSLISGKVSTDIIGITENPDFPDRYLPVYGEAYANRLPNYSRLDLRLSRDSILFGNDSQFYIDIRNVLNKENVESRSLDYEVVNATSELHVKDSVSMGIFGSIGFTVRF